jgi:hypothetical protein
MESETPVEAVIVEAPATQEIEGARAIGEIDVYAAKQVWGGADDSLVQSMTLIDKIRAFFNL